MTFTERLRLFPPILCRLLAFSNGKALTTEEIVRRAGKCSPNELAVTFYDMVSVETDWLKVPTLEMVHFTRGTLGGSFDDVAAMRRIDNYLRHNPTFAYLRRSKEWNSRFKPMMAKWRNKYPYNIAPIDVPYKPLRAVLNRLTPLHASHNLNPRA